MYSKWLFRLKKPIYRSFQSSWFIKWSWLHYDQVNHKAFCFTCLKPSTTETLSSGGTVGQMIPSSIVDLTTGKTLAEKKKLGFLCTSGHTFTGNVQVYSLDHTIILLTRCPLSTKNKTQSIILLLAKQGFVSEVIGYQQRRKGIRRRNEFQFPPAFPSTCTRWPKLFKGHASKNA